YEQNIPSKPVTNPKFHILGHRAVRLETCINKHLIVYPGNADSRIKLQPIALVYLAQVEVGLVEIVPYVRLYRYPVHVVLYATRNTRFFVVRALFGLHAGIVFNYLFQGCIVEKVKSYLYVKKTADRLLKLRRKRVGGIQPVVGNVIVHAG